jgi:hypothetical protein
MIRDDLAAKKDDTLNYRMRIVSPELVPGTRYKDDTLNFLMRIVSPELRLTNAYCVPGTQVSRFNRPSSMRH